MTEQDQQPAPHNPPTTYGGHSAASHAGYDQQNWPPLAGGPGVPPADKRKQFIKNHGLTLGLTAVAVIVAGSLGVGIGKATAGTPAVCIEAIDLANEGFGLAGDAIDASSAAVSAATSRSTTGMGRASDDMEDVADEMTALSPKWKAAQQGCTGKAS